MTTAAAVQQSDGNVHWNTYAVNHTFDALIWKYRNLCENSIDLASKTIFFLFERSILESSIDSAMFLESMNRAESARNIYLTHATRRPIVR